MYEWDEAKRKANLRKHGLDFADASLVYEDPKKLTLISAWSEESRNLDLAFAEIHGTLLCLVYTERGDNVRVISFRRASRRERRLYAAIQG